MGLCLSKGRSNIEPSVPVPTPTARPRAPQPQSIPDGTISTRSRKRSTPQREPSTPMTQSERTRAQTQAVGTGFSQRRHDNGRDYYPPPSSHPVMYSPRSIQIAMWIGIDPNRLQQLWGVHHREGIGRHQVDVDHASLPLCRAYFTMTSGMHSGTILSDHEY